MGDFRKKKKLLQRNTWGKGPALKKIYILWSIMLTKICYTIICLGKNPTSIGLWEKKSLTQTKSNPLQPTKSNGQMERKYQPQIGEKEPATLERERKKSRLGQTQFDVFNKLNG